MKTKNLNKKYCIVFVIFVRCFTNLNKGKNMKPIHKRILLKLSGEALMGDREFGLDPDIIERVAKEIAGVHKLGVEICLVVGGGNIFRGISAASQGMDRVSGDHMGMLATVINSLALQTALENQGIFTRVQSAITMNTICEPYIRRRAMRHMEKGRIVIFAAGTGNPFFTTDSAAALRASEMDCNALLKATKVDGVYDSDPVKNPNAIRYETITYQEVLEKNLGVMDAAAISVARENDVPIIIFSVKSNGELAKVVCGEGKFTTVKH